MNILELKDLSLKLGGSRILNGINLELWDGYVHALVGPNGAGKSTLAFTIMGLSDYRDIDGDIIFDGESLKALGIDARAKRGITLGWQEPARFEGLTVRQFIGAAAKSTDEMVIRNSLDQLGMKPDDYIDRAVDSTLSGGERKKIELASILAMEPKLVLLDEPDSGIDVESLKRIFEAIKVLKDKGATVVLITHSLEVLEQAEHAFLICRGEVVDKGNVDKIIPYFKGKCIPCDHKNQPDLELKEGE